ncbi:unnamed protein product [Adineta ricciae]|uniref:protein-serine/threonine phosphatase n=1 Tax=Adineta ricciae TaxID=249248 RepID=A0A814B3Y8_ADIRI|nr:unnamed protein product [Adineta ricciae]CAF1202599.1 unnamed protein product [Adineta ricciae]
MGAYLASPICDKDTVDGSNENFAFAASSMQGWRMSQEDAHNAILNFDDKTSFFAVYDGHGGAEIALYCSRHLPDFIKQLDSYREGRLQDALVEGFLKFDALLLDPKVKEILQVLADSKDKADDSDEDIDDQSASATLPTSINKENNHQDELNAEEAHLLRKEAELPIEELMKRYSADKRTGEKSSTNTEQQTNVVSQSNEENTPADDVLDHKIAETITNGELANAVEAKPSSSEPKTTTKRSRKPVSTDTPTKKTSLTHHLLSENIDDLDDDDNDEDEDDFELEGSDEETSNEDEEVDDDDGEEAEEEDEEDEEEDDDDDDDDDDDKQVKTNKAAQIKKLMKKSIMAILNRHPKKKKQSDESEDDAKENQNDENDDDEYEDEEEEEDDDDDNESDVDLGKMLDMSNDPGSSSGCTAVVTLVRDKQLFVANAGDSRCVVCRGGRAIEMSLDHKPEDPPERSRIEKAGYKVTLDGRVSGGLNLSRAIGDHAYKKNANLPAEEQAITALPDIRTLTLEDQDEFMVIACDGIWNFMSSQDVVDFVRTRLDKKNLSQICEELFTHCLAPNTSGDGTGCDNMTAIIAKFNFNKLSEASKTGEHSPWPVMFSATNNKRSLSPDHTSNELADNNSGKKLKSVTENGTNETLSPSKTSGVFSFNTAANNSNSTDDKNSS